MLLYATHHYLQNWMQLYALVRRSLSACYIVESRRIDSVRLAVLPNWEI